jgi:SAM-dependent methyltransferase
MRSVQVNERTYRTWCEMHPDELVDPVIEAKAIQIAKRLNLTPEELTERVNDGGLNVRDKWNELHPDDVQDTENFYGREDSGYFYDLLTWNRTELYQSIIAPLKDVRDRDVLVVGPGIGGEIDPLLEGDNRVTVRELPGALLSFLKDYYGDKIGYLDFADRQFDMIVAVDVLEHVHPAGFTAFLDMLLDLLRDEGVLYAHNNFGQKDLYPMHYPENREQYEAWIDVNFAKENDYTYRKLVKELA